MIYLIICEDVQIDDFEYMTIEFKWQVILADSGYNNLVCGCL